MKRKIIKIDEEKCNGCAACIPGCPEGALQIVDGKARLVADVYCDGLGACIGHCPEGAILVEDREAAEYDEELAIRNIVKQGPPAVEAHLRHLQEHNEHRHLKTALEFLRRERGPQDVVGGGCPGSRSAVIQPSAPLAGAQQSGASRLTHWPIQLHLIQPMAPHYHGSDLLLAADCAAYAVGGFHERFMKGRTLAIACPKLDRGQEAYLEKLVALVDGASIRSIAVVIMQVPCCSGLFQLARLAVERSTRKIPVEATVVGLDGTVLNQFAIPGAGSHG